MKEERVQFAGEALLYYPRSDMSNQQEQKQSRAEGRGHLGPPDVHREREE